MPKTKGGTAKRSKAAAAAVPDSGPVQHAAEEFRMVQVADIRREGNYRRTFDEDKLAELTASVREKGIIEPLIVRPVPGGLGLVAGERRLIAAERSGLELVPALIRPYSDREVLEIQIIENVQRENPGVFDEAEGYRRLRSELGYDVATIAEKIGKSKRYVYQRIEVADVAKPVREAVNAGSLTANHAILIARLPLIEQQMEAFEWAMRGGDGDTSVRELDRYIKRDLLLKLDAAPFDRSDAELCPPAGTCDACSRRSGNARELFAELSSPDICTNRNCYEQKVDLHINREIQRAADLVQIKGWGYWAEAPKHVYDRNAYALIEKPSQRCGSVARGIVVYGEGRGEIKDICFSVTCKKHRGEHSGRGAGDEERRAKARAEKAETETGRAVRGAIVDAILAHAPEDAHHAVLETLVEEWWGDLNNDKKRLVLKRHKWDADTLPVGDLTTPELVRLLIEFSLAGHLWVARWMREKGVPADLAARAEEARVDWAEIERETRESRKPKVKGRLAEVLA